MVYIKAHGKVIGPFQSRGQARTWAAARYGWLAARMGIWQYVDPKATVR